MSGQARRAAQLLGAADTVRAEAGANVMPFLALLLAPARESALAALGTARFQAGFEAGQRLDRDGGLRLALGKLARDGPARGPGCGTGRWGGSGPARAPRSPPGWPRSTGSGSLAVGSAPR